MEKSWKANWKNSPGNEDKHYDGEMQPIEYFASDFHESMSANVDKYVLRHEKKGGKIDLEKAKWYVDWLRRSLDYPDIHAGDYIAANPDLEEDAKEVILMIERFEEIRYEDKVAAYAVLDTVENHIDNLIKKHYE